MAEVENGAEGVENEEVNGDAAAEGQDVPAEGSDDEGADGAEDGAEDGDEPSDGVQTSGDLA